MFRYKTVLLLLIITGFISGCGPGNAESIKIDKLKEPCDCSEAYIKIINDLNETLEGRSVDDAEEDPELREALKTKFTILKDVEDKCLNDLDFKLEEIYACDGELEELINGDFSANF